MPAGTHTNVRIGFVASADAQFKAPPEKIRAGLLAKLKELALNPALGKPLLGPLQGCSRITYGRYRCVVRITNGVAVVLVLVIAKRKAGSEADAYALAQRVMAEDDPSVQEAFTRHLRAFIEEQRAARPCRSV